MDKQSSNKPSGDERTPDKTIGEIAYAEKEAEKEKAGRSGAQGFDRGKAGLQDDHDPRDPAQKQNNKRSGP